MDRREFIKTSCMGCAAVLGVGLLLESCTNPKYITSFTIQQGKMQISKKEFIEVQKERTVQKKFMLVKPEGSQFPVAIYKRSETEYVSLLLQCTHQGCELSAYETTLVCPCHGAEFNSKGEVTQGPAEANLKSFPTWTDNDNVYIQLQ